MADSADPRASVRRREWDASDDRDGHRGARLVGSVRHGADSQPGAAVGDAGAATPDRTRSARRRRVLRRAARLPGAQQRLRSTLPLRRPRRRRTSPLRRGPAPVGGGPRLPLGGLRVPHRRRGGPHPADRLPAAPADGRVPGLVLRHAGVLRPNQPRDRPALRGGRRHLTGTARARGGAARQRHHAHGRPRRAHLGPHLERRARCRGGRSLPAALPHRLPGPVRSGRILAGGGRHGPGRLRCPRRPDHRARRDLRRPVRPGRPLAVRALGPRADHHLLLALGGAVLRQVGHRCRPLRPVPAGGVHPRGVRGTHQSEWVAGAAARGFPGRTSPARLRRDAGALLHPGRLAGRG